MGSRITNESCSRSVSDFNKEIFHVSDRTALAHLLFLCYADKSTEKEDSDGNMCGGIMEPVGVWVRPDGTWEIIQRCGFCGEMKTAELSEEDSSVKILSIASKPLASPPFPVEKIEELTMIMGGNDFEIGLPQSHWL